MEDCCENVTRAEKEKAFGEEMGMDLVDLVDGFTLFDEII